MLTGKIQRLGLEERENLKRKKENERETFEAANCGDFELIYPHNS